MVKGVGSRKKDECMEAGFIFKSVFRIMQLGKASSKNGYENLYKNR